MKSDAIPADLAIPILVDDWSDEKGIQPVAVGVPLPRGDVAPSWGWTLHDGTGRPIPLRSAVQLGWPDGSVKWLLVEFLLEPGLGVDKGLTLRPDGAAGPGEPRDCDLAWTGDGSLCWRNSADPDRAIPIEFQLSDAAGEGRLPRRRSDSPPNVLLGRLGNHWRFAAKYEDGPDLVIDAASWRDGAAGALLRLDVGLLNPRRARHAGGRWDLGDPGSRLFGDLSIKIPCDGAVQLSLAPDADVKVVERLELFQASSGGENWKSRNHVNAAGEVPCPFRGYRLLRDGQEERGDRASPTLSFASFGQRIALGLPRFWEEFPKALSHVPGEGVRVGLFPREFGDPFELQGGERKFTTLWLAAAPSGEGASQALAWLGRPAFARVSPDWVRKSGVIPCLGTGAPGIEHRFQNYVSAIAIGPTSFAARREVIDEFGWRNFGEIYADHEQRFFKGDGAVISHYNNQYDVLLGLLTQELRGGGREWRDLADPLARHVADIDIYHTSEDKAAYNRGLFWHTDHYFSAGTATHRTYSRFNAGGAASYGGGPATMHLFTSGLALHWLLTGEERSREAALELADWVLAAEDGARNLLGVLDDGPTGQATKTADADYHGPGRGVGNSINAMLDAHELTADPRFLVAAETFIRRAAHPSDDPGERDLSSAERRWSYTIFLVSLDKYLRQKETLGQLDASYAHARGCLLRYATWMAEHERPYLDRPEELEFLTEAWAAQEFRKASVLRLAARYADADLSAKMRIKADSINQRAWDDLPKYGRPDTARARAIIMIEGSREAFFSDSDEPLAPPAPTIGVGDPEQFVGQRERIKRMIKSPKTWPLVAFRLLSPGRWRRYLHFKPKSV